MMIERFWHWWRILCARHSPTFLFQSL
jgi:hypothetical protein